MVRVLAFVAAVALIVSTVQDKCFDSKCWSKNNSMSIPCDHQTSHCDLDQNENPICKNGSTGAGVECDTTNKFFHRACNEDKHGRAYCDYMDAIIFWVMIGLMATLFMIVQLWLACIYCKARHSGSSSNITIQTASAEHQGYGGTATDNFNPAIAGGVRLFPSDIERLLPAEPGDSNFADNRSSANAPPPSYNEVTGPEFYNPPVNPYFSQLT